MNMSENEMEIAKKNFWPDAKNYKFNDEGYKEAIKMAVGDLMVRTLKRKSGKTNNLLIDLCSEGESFLEHLKKWFKEDITSLDKQSLKNKFDNMHKIICKNVLNILQKYYTNSDGTDVCYGKAQKIVNMTFKYLYCIPGTNKKEDYFTYCHVALDTFTLEWLYRKCKTTKRTIIRDNLVPWSNITNKECKKNGKEIYSYEKLQEIFRELVTDPKTDLNLTPFQTEFYIWPQMRLTLACEHLYSLQSKENLSEFRNKSLNEKISELRNCIDSIKFEDTNCFI